MKKGIITTLALFISFLSHSQTIICDATFPAPEIVQGYGRDYTGKISIGCAQTKVKNYISLAAASQIDNQIGFFIFDAGTLFNFIYQINKANLRTTPLQDMDFVLGRDATGTLTLFIVGLTADHKTALYYNDNILANPLAGDLTDPFEQLTINPKPAQTILTQVMCSSVAFPAPILPNSYSALLPKANAQRLLAALGNPPAGTPISFMFDPGTLCSLLTSTVGIQNVAAVFGLEGGKIKMLIIGVDGQGNPLGMNIGGFNFCLEHCYPCPDDCPGTQIGSSLNSETHLLR